MGFWKDHHHTFVCQGKLSPHQKFMKEKISASCLSRYADLHVLSYRFLFLHYWQIHLIFSLYLATGVLRLEFLLEIIWLVIYLQLHAFRGLNDTCSTGYGGWFAWWCLKYCSWHQRKPCSLGSLLFIYLFYYSHIMKSCRSINGTLYVILMFDIQWALSWVWSFSLLFCSIEGNRPRVLGQNRRFTELHSLDWFWFKMVSVKKGYSSKWLGFSSGFNLGLVWNFLKLP